MARKPISKRLRFAVLKYFSGVLRQLREGAKG